MIMNDSRKDCGTRRLFWGWSLVLMLTSQFVLFVPVRRVLIALEQMGHPLILPSASVPYIAVGFFALSAALLYYSLKGRIPQRLAEFGILFLATPILVLAVFLAIRSMS